MLFGATGDLAKRKLLPGLAHLALSALAPDIQVVGTSLEDMDDDEFREFARQAVDAFGTHKLTDEQWAAFAGKLHYVPQGAGPGGAGRRGGQGRGASSAPEVRRLHYLSVPPKAALRRHHDAQATPTWSTARGW